MFNFSYQLLYVIRYFVNEKGIDIHTDRTINDIFYACCLGSMHSISTRNQLNSAHMLLQQHTQKNLVLGVFYTAHAAMAACMHSIYIFLISGMYLNSTCMVPRQHAQKNHIIDFPPCILFLCSAESFRVCSLEGAAKRI